MSLAPLIEAPLVIQLHVACAVPALVIGPFALFRTRRDRIHKVLGRVWIVAMLGLALTGLTIPSEIAVLWHLGPIHLLSFFTIYGVIEGFSHIRRGNIASHQAAMRNLWFGALGLGGLLTLLPGRVLNRMVFGAYEQLAWVVIVLGLAGLLFLRRRQFAGLASGA